MPDMHRFGDVRRTEIDDDGARVFRFLDEGKFVAGGGVQRLRQRGCVKAKIDEAGARQFHFFAPFADIQPGQYLGCKLARIHLPLLGQRHQRVALVVAELRIGARADEQRPNVRIRKNLASGLLQTVLEKSMDHGWKANGSRRDADVAARDAVLIEAGWRRRRTGP